MNPSWLAQLAAEHPPAPAGWWPLAPGWRLLAALGLAAAVTLVWWLTHRGRGLQAGLTEWVQNQGPRHAALSELRVIRETASDPSTLARMLENLLRRYALAVFGPERVASLTGDAWLALVVAEGGEQLADGPGRSLLAAAFGGRASDDREHWLAAAEGFLRQAPRRRQTPADR